MVFEISWNSEYEGDEGEGNEGILCNFIFLEVLTTMFYSQIVLAKKGPLGKIW
jgi:hypothetical protein